MQNLNTLNGTSSSFNIQELSLQENQVYCVCTWKINGKTIRVLRNQDNLGCEVFDQAMMCIKRRPIEIPKELAINEAVKGIINSHVFFKEEKKSLEFCNSCLDVNAPNKEMSLSLIQTDNDGLIWQLFDRVKKEAFQVPFQSIIPSPRCYEKTCEVIDGIATKSIEDQIDFLKNFVISDVIPNKEFYTNNIKNQVIKNNNSGCEINFEDYSFKLHQDGGFSNASEYLNSKDISLLSIGAAASIISPLLGSIIFMGHVYTKDRFLFERKKSDVTNILIHVARLLKSMEKIEQLKPSFFIEIEPISVKSKFDDRVLISKFTWAVTLIGHKGYRENHAQIIVEGIDDGFYKDIYLKDRDKIRNGDYFGYRIDFDFNPRTLENKIKFIYFEKDKTLKYSSRSEVWMRPSAQVKEMLRSVKFKVDNKIAPKFTIYGNDSWFKGAGEHNCFTCVREILSTVDIKLEKTYLGKIIAIVREYTYPPEYYKDKAVLTQI